MNVVIICYFIFINLLAFIVFIGDKRRAEKNRQRISENMLHGLEFLGGVFAIIFCMYAFRHKNRKASYYLISYAMLSMWITILVISCK